MTTSNDPFWTDTMNSKAGGSAGSSSTQSLHSPLVQTADLASGQAQAADVAALDEAIATDLSPSVAIALLAKSDHGDEALPPAMLCMGAGVSESTLDDHVRVQFLFGSGSVLPVDMPRKTGEALVRGLAAELGMLLK
jgi:hypothetical protein